VFWVSLKSGKELYTDKVLKFQYSMTSFYHPPAFGFPKNILFFMQLYIKETMNFKEL
jgi:hypothetical protein